MHILRYLSAAVLATVGLNVSAELVAHFDMQARNGMITESVSGQKFNIEGNFTPENLPGAVGDALRFDGYTSHIKAHLDNIISADSNQLTVSCWLATPSYPIIQLDTDTSEQAPVISCLDSEKKTGFGFYLGFDGRYSFRTYIGGWPLILTAGEPLPTYEWCHLTAIIDTSSRSAKLYNNGVEVASGKANGTISFSPCDLYMGQGVESRLLGPFQLISFNGLIDDISIWNEAKPIEELNITPANEPNLDIPASRFADDLLRPRFHGMPAAGWTNECHGMYRSDGRYHLFFQKNADGPYMARLHWGHISSENLYDWTEEKIALAPGEPYDIKGCWSGCVFADEEITGGKPNILYTAVDYTKATIAQAYPLTDALDNWVKNPSNPIINGRPAGLSDDFRDPYFFRSGDKGYIIVGTSKNGIGATTLHTYNPISGQWSNNGDTFFTGTSASQDGVFWEMPNVTPMPDGKWLFTATPLSTSQGVRTLYWTGEISDNGKFIPDAYSTRPRMLELESREGFGLLSPTIYRHDDKTIALGIVPDKLPASVNWQLGWAHCYSLPREWSLDPAGNLIQKPFEGLREMRSTIDFHKYDFTAGGNTLIDINPVSGRAFELSLEFEKSAAALGFNIFKSGNSHATISYRPAENEVLIDLSGLERMVNDEGVYNGLYHCPIPEAIPAGDTVKLNIFADHSILDIFVNDRWATSIRLFPTAKDADGIEFFSEGAVNIKYLDGWTLKSSASGIQTVDLREDQNSISLVDVVDISGRVIRRKIPQTSATAGLTPGLYIVGARKTIVR